jgi:asparagine synthase (glutamine-hydrolysing)
MCGFAGIYEYGLATGGVTADVVRRMRDTLIHRGPDGEGLFVSQDARVGLGHRRLAIVDIAGGAQPMLGARGECLVFNGEIYNYPQLRRRLESEGVAFETACDTEVILHLYARHGVDCLEWLNGMFAFALWDGPRERLMLARDRVGEKPLYWADAGGRLVFGSEIKAIVEHPAVTAEVNAAQLAPYLANLVTPGPSTLYEGIQKLAPGSVALCDRRGIRISRYWSTLQPRSWTGGSLEDAAQSVRSMLEASVHERMMSDVPVGVLLSGGLDSTTLVALLRERAEGLATFSIGFEDHAALDERAEARRVATHFNTDHHELTMSESDALGFLPGLIHHQDEPLADPVCLPLHFVCRLARDSGVKVVLAGEGADELFWGYPRYRQMLSQKRWLGVTLSAPGFLRRLTARSVPARRHPYMREVLDGIARGRLLPAHVPLGLSRHHREAMLRAADGDGATPGWSSSDAGAALAGGDWLSTFAFDTQEYEFTVRLPELLLMRIDRFSMANSVEARVPFLDPKLVELVYRLPLRYKLDAGETKIVMKRAIEDAVPRWVIERKKQGFGAPVLDWLGTRFGDLFREVALDEEMARYFDIDLLAATLRSARRASVVFSLWPVLNFALWHRYWIQGRLLPELADEMPAEAA